MKRRKETSEQRKNPLEYTYGETWFQAYKTLTFIVYVTRGVCNMMIYDVNVHCKCD